MSTPHLKSAYVMPSPIHSASRIQRSERHLAMPSLRDKFKNKSITPARNTESEPKLKREIAVYLGRKAAESELKLPITRYNISLTTDKITIKKRRLHNQILKLKEIAGNL
jgi:hypothetical protein